MATQNSLLKLSMRLVRIHLVYALKFCFLLTYNTCILKEFLELVQKIFSYSPDELFQQFSASGSAEYYTWYVDVFCIYAWIVLLFLYACRDIVQMIICVFLTCIHLYACIYDMCMFCMYAILMCAVLLGFLVGFMNEWMYVCM